MRFFILVIQFVGVVALVPIAAILTLWLDARSGDGPSVIFRGGEFTSGQVYEGPEPDWSFTNEIRLVCHGSYPRFASSVCFLDSLKESAYYPLFLFDC